MTEHEHKTTSTVSAKLKRTLDDVAKRLRRPHHDAEERRQHQRAAKRAGSNPRRQG